jgi:hypothetical protein
MHAAIDQIIGVTVNTGLRQFEDYPASRFKVNDVFRPFVQSCQRVGTLGRVLTTLHPLHEPRAFARDHLLYDFIFRAARNLAACFMASENVIEDGSAATAVLTRRRTPANTFSLFGFGRHFDL